MGATGDMAGGEESSLSLYMFRCYLLCLYKVLTVVLYSTVLGVDSNFQTLSNCQDQTSIFILIVIFDTNPFPNDKDIMEFIHSLLSV